jgi:hypothetical protein
MCTEKNAVHFETKKKLLWKLEFKEKNAYCALLYFKRKLVLLGYLDLSPFGARNWVGNQMP